MTHLQFHKTLACIVNLCAKLYQKLWRCLKTQLSHREGDGYQNWFVFHELLITVELCMNILVDCEDCEGVKTRLRRCKKFVTDKMVKQRIIDYSFKYLAEDRKQADSKIAFNKFFSTFL